MFYIYLFGNHSVLLCVNPVIPDIFINPLFQHSVQSIYIPPWEVFSGFMYMGVFGSGSPKPHKLYSNDESLLNAIIAKAGYMSRADQSRCEVKTTTRYIDKNGKRRCVGNKSALKESAYLSNPALLLFGFTFKNLSVSNHRFCNFMFAPSSFL